MKKSLKFTLRVIVVLFILLNVVVIFHAYKFTHFYEPDEVTIKAHNDKSTWDITKEMLFGINSIKQKNIAPDSTYKVIYLTTKDGLKLEGWYNTVSNAKGSIAMFHGHGSKKSAIIQEAEAFQQMGYNTFLLDFRAHGNSEGNTCTIGFYESEDVKLAYNYLQKNGEKNIIFWGISLGAATITKGVNDFNLMPAKIILEMPFGSLSEAVSGRVKMMGLPTQPISTLLTFWGGVEHGFWAFNMKPYEYVKKIKCPVLIQKGKLDPRVTDAEAETIYKNISAEKKLVYYYSSGHQSLCANENMKWISEVNAFLKK
jgi:uncharacterized protein